MASQRCAQSNDSTINRTSSLLPPLKTVQYGPITVRICRKTVPTLKTGRRSKNLVLVGDDAIERERQREKKREVAKKIKNKRQSIESELNQNIRDLEHQHSLLRNHVEQLHHRQQLLFFTLNIQELNEIDEILQDVFVDDTPVQEAQSSLGMESLDDTLEYVINTCSNSTTDN